MSGISIITGGGSGIGAALAKRLVSRSQPVLIVGRREEKLLQTKDESANPSLVRTVVADISKMPESHDAILGSLKENEKVNYLVHNAAVLEPVKKLMDVTHQEWIEHMATNVDGPLFLTKALIPKLRGVGGEKGGRVLHVSSGAAHHGYRGWGAYCTSKAGLHMIYKVLAAELDPLGITVGSVRPGVVDTPMQDLIRGKDSEEMPDVSRFKVMKDQGSLINPDEVAGIMDWLLHETDDVEFSEKEWDVRDEDMHRRWQSYL